jgi:hypothetical protein
MSIQPTTSPLPRKVLSNNRYCVLEYTPELQRSSALRRYSLPRYPSTPVPDNPHAMTVCIGVSHVGDEVRPEFATPHVPGVLVETDQFVSGYHYGIEAAYEDSSDGVVYISEQEVIKTYQESAANTVMLNDNEGDGYAFSAGFLFGYVHGCTMINTDAFQHWASVPEIVAGGVAS